MRDRKDEFGDAEIVVVQFTRQRNLKGYRNRFDIPFTMLADEERNVYRQYGLDRLGVGDLISPKLAFRYAKRIAGGARPQRPTEDTMQMGGDFVIDAAGRLVFAHPSHNPEDFPDLGDLVGAARSGGR